MADPKAAAAAAAALRIRRTMAYVHIAACFVLQCIFLPILVFFGGRSFESMSSGLVNRLTALTFICFLGHWLIKDMGDAWSLYDIIIAKKHPWQYWVGGFMQVGADLASGHKHIKCGNHACVPLH